MSDTTLYNINRIYMTFCDKHLYAFVTNPLLYALISISKMILDNYMSKKEKKMLKKFKFELYLRDKSYCIIKNIVFKLQCVF